MNRNVQCAQPRVAMTLLAVMWLVALSLISVRGPGLSVQAPMGVALSAVGWYDDVKHFQSQGLMLGKSRLNLLLKLKIQRKYRSRVQFQKSRERRERLAYQARLSELKSRQAHWMDRQDRMWSSKYCD